jgi:RNA polymerase sigma factor (sigma-70 family)
MKQPKQAQEASSEKEINKSVREKIFNIPLMPQEEVVPQFEKLDQILQPLVLRLVCESALIRNYFNEIVFRIASGNTLGRNYYNREDAEGTNKDLSEKKKKELLKNCEQRVLKTSFSLIRPGLKAKEFARIVPQIGFIRGVYEEAIELFLETTKDFDHIVEGLQKSKAVGSLDYLKYERQYERLQNELHLTNPDQIRAIIDETMAGWDLYTTQRSKIIEPYFRLVYKLAGKFSSGDKEQKDAQTLDNFQNGVFGILRAVKQYTPSRAAAFSIVAETWIKQSILLKIKTDSNFIQLPVANWHLFQKLEKVRKAIEQRTQRDATHEQISKESGQPIEKVQKIYENAKLVKVHSLDTPTSNEEDQNVGANWNKESIQHPSDMEENLVLKSEYRVVEKVVESFDEEERTIFGLISGCAELIPEPEFTAKELLREKIRQKAARLGIEITFKEDE